MEEIMTNIGNGKSRNSVIETIVHIVPKEVVLGPNPLSVNHLAVNNHCSRAPFFQHFIVVFAAEFSYLWYRQKNRMDCIAGVYDKFCRTDDEAWQAQNQIPQNDPSILNGKGEGFRNPNQIDIYL